MRRKISTIEKIEKKNINNWEEKYQQLRKLKRNILTFEKKNMNNCSGQYSLRVPLTLAAAPQNAWRRWRKARCAPGRGCTRAAIPRRRSCARRLGGLRHLSFSIIFFFKSIIKHKKISCALRLMGDRRI